MSDKLITQLITACNTATQEDHKMLQLQIAPSREYYVISAFKKVLMALRNDQKQDDDFHKRTGSYFKTWGQLEVWRRGAVITAGELERIIRDETWRSSHGLARLLCNRLAGRRITKGE